MVGFTGSRSLAQSYFTFVSHVALALSGLAPFVIGCASGLDLFVLQVARSNQIQHWLFAAADYGSGKSAYALRSIAMVRTVARDSFPLFVGFPGRPCAPALAPSPNSAACFSGFGSGTWATLAFAAGLGLPVLVFPVAGLAPAQLPTTWGTWQSAPGHLGSLGAWQLAPVQPSLF